MKRALPKLNGEQIAFICTECAITKDELFSMNEDDLYDRVYDIMCDIEIAEIGIEEDGSDSERCEIASDIVTIMGNALRKSCIEKYGDDQLLGDPE